MLKKIIIIENGKQYQYDTESEVVKKLISEQYYELCEKDRQQILKKKAIANSLNNNMEILDSAQIEKSAKIDNKFILLNERTYILSLLTADNIILLERVDSNIFTNSLDKSKFTKKYIVVNKFAKQILKQLLFCKGYDSK